jgi:hypothetical protein
MAFQALGTQDDVVSGRCGLKAALYAQDLEKPRAVCDLTVVFRGGEALINAINNDHGIREGL